MKYSNLKRYMDENNAVIFECDEIKEDGIVNHLKMLYYVSYNGSPVINPEAKKILDIVKKEREQEQQKQEKTEVENEKNENEKISVYRKLIALVLIGAGTILITSQLSGCSYLLSEDNKNDNLNETKIESEEELDTSTSLNDETVKGYVQELSYTESVADIKNIELEFEKYGLIDSSKKEEAMAIKKGIAAVYVRANSSILPKETLELLYKNGFIAKDSIQVVGDSFKATSPLMTYYEYAYLNNISDTLDPSIFCKDELDKKVVSTVFEIAKENYTSEDKTVISDNMDTLIKYYQNLETEVLPYYGTSHDADVLTHLGAHIAGLGAARNGYNGKKVEAMEDLISFGNFSKDARELSKICPWFTVEEQKIITLD